MENRSEGLNARELPKYKCHKEVWALKIKSIHLEDDGSLTITPVEDGYGPFPVAREFVPTHDAARPQKGWYFVLYEDGYKSFSPASAFEGGYTLIR